MHDFHSDWGRVGWGDLIQHCIELSQTLIVNSSSIPPLSHSSDIGEEDDGDDDDDDDDDCYRTPSIDDV